MFISACTDGHPSFGAHQLVYVESLGSNYFKSESVVKSDHVYRAIWTPVTGEELTAQPENHNDHAVLLTTDSCTVRYILHTVSCVVILVEAWW